MDPILDNLNDEQRKAVLQQDGAVLIIAGAGSGKTRVLTSKIALLLRDGVLPEELLALTFTRKAAGEMKWRVREMVGERAKGLSIGTFHSVFAKTLRTYYSHIKFPEDFTIYDESDSESCLKQCIGETLWGPSWNDKAVLKGLTDEQKRERKSLMKTYKPSVIHGRISLLKNELILPREYRESYDLIERDRRAGRERFADIYSLYMRKCHLAGAMDFDDILVYTHHLLKKFPEVRHTLADRYTHILIDEYQDTNKVQNEIIRMLAGVHGNICVVGDDSQSIYAFRGAKIENILQFKEDYPRVKTFRLESNYRSTPEIVNAANRLIANNLGRIPKTCKAIRPSGEKIRLEGMENDREEARFVKDYILGAVQKGKARYSDFAVLYRTNAQARALEDEMLKARVPYLVYSGTSFFDRAEVKDVLAYFRLVVNVKDDEAFKRICNRPSRGISDATLAALMAENARTGAPLFTVAEDAAAGEVLPEMKERVRGALGTFTKAVWQLRADILGMDAYQAGKTIVERSGIFDYYKGEEGEDGLKKSNNITELLGSIQYFIQDTIEEWEQDLPEGAPKTGLLDYLENIALLSNADTRSRDGHQSDCVSLMTSHCSKGLEFPTVFLVGVEEGLYPLIRENSTKFDEEEERRLFYVSVTRAMDRLIMTSCGSRRVNGSWSDAAPSRFVEEMGILPAEEEDDEEDIIGGGVKDEYGFLEEDELF